MRVLVADDETNVRSALRLLLDQDPGVSAVCEAGAAECLLAQAEATRPDVVLLDWQLPGLQATDLLPALRSVCPRLVVIALSGRPEECRTALAAGVDAFVCKGDAPERLLATLSTVLAGREELLL